SLVTRPCFLFIRCRSRSAPVTHQVQGYGIVRLRKRFPAPGKSSAPENCRYHAASKVIGFTNPVALPVRGPTPLWLTAWAYHLIKSPPSCLCLQGWDSGQSNLMVLSQPLFKLTAPSQPKNSSYEKARATSNGTSSRIT